MLTIGLVIMQFIFKQLRITLLFYFEFKLLRFIFLQLWFWNMYLLNLDFSFHLLLCIWNFLILS